jgi:hypothetical protein
MEACINRPVNVYEVLSPIYVVAGAPRARGAGGGVRGGVGVFFCSAKALKSSESFKHY